MAIGVCDLAEHVRAVYAADGVEVMSEGKNSITLALPPTLVDFSVMVADFADRFDATVDLHKVGDTMQLTCWPAAVPDPWHHGLCTAVLNAASAATLLAIGWALATIKPSLSSFNTTLFSPNTN